MKKFLNTMSILFAGLTTASLWLTGSERWKLYLPICLTCIVFGQSLSGKKETPQNNNVPEKQNYKYPRHRMKS